jgi:hypothetical protein
MVFLIKKLMRSFIKKLMRTIISLGDRYSPRKKRKKKEGSIG